MSLRAARLVAVLAGFAVLVAACGGDDGSSSSSTTTSSASTTSTGSGTTATTASGSGSSGGSGGSGGSSGSGSQHQGSSSSSAYIESLQRELDALGCNAGPMDGKLGPDTLGAIRHFQSAAGITVDGIVGPVTTAKLQAAALSGTPNCTSVPAPPTPPTTTKPAAGPPCSIAPIKAGVQASLLPGESIVLSGAFNCAGNYVVNTPTIASNGQQQVVTDLLYWNGTAWQVVNRAVYCENGSVPAAIYQKACQAK